jgi:hypothetical protein
MSRLGNAIKQFALRQQANTYSVTIASGAAVSSAVDANALGPRGLAVLVPVAWTAADIALEVSDDDITYYPVYDEFGSRVKISNVATAEIRTYILPAAAWLVGAYMYLRLVSIDTSSGANTNQAAARALGVRILS